MSLRLVDTVADDAVYKGAGAELTVSELSKNLKRVVEATFARIRVRGEISQPKVAASGHCYLRLKDDGAVIDAVIWRGVASKLQVRPEEGLEVTVEGRLSTYPARSSYQIVIDSMRLAGEGALLKMLEQRRQLLQAEGLFAPERKQPLPFAPQTIGVVTSPTGAVIRDILHRIDDRFPCRIVLWPTLVQGADAPRQVAAAISGFNALPGPDRATNGLCRPDVLIVARGGGSIEDLMAFNDEMVVRAVAASRIPVISAVGHETDVTLCDHVADLRAPTPSAAAEMAVPERFELLRSLNVSEHRLQGAAHRFVEGRAIQLRAAARGLPPLRRLLEERIQRLDDRWQHVELAAAAVFERKRAILLAVEVRLHPGALHRERARKAHDAQVAATRLSAAKIRLLGTVTQRLAVAGERLEANSYHRTLKRGYAAVWGVDGGLITSCANIGTGDTLTLELADGKRPVAALEEWTG